MDWKEIQRIPVNSLVLSEMYRFWAEFDGFKIEFENSPVFFAVFLLGCRFFAGLLPLLVAAAHERMGDRMHRERNAILYANLAH